MTVAELMEILEELDGGMEVNLAYQPHYPMMVKANHVKVCDGQAFICQSGYGGNDYAPDHLFDDDENCTEDIKDMCFDEEDY